MHPFRQRLFSHLRFRAAAYVILLVALVPTCIIYWKVRDTARAHDEAHLQAIAGVVEETVRDSFERLVADLVMFSGFFEASDSIAEREWNAFITKLDLERRHPGIRSVGFAHQIEKENAAAFAQRMHKQGRANFAIRPPVALPLSFPTVLFSQFPTNSSGGVGWDSYSDSDRRPSIQKAMRTGQPAVTGKMWFWRNTVKEAEGITIVVPAQTSGFTGARDQWRGVIFSTFVPQEFFNELPAKKFDGLVAVEMFDGTEPRPAALLGSFAKDTNDLIVSELAVTKVVQFLERPFLLRVTPLPEFAARSERHLPMAVLACGLGLSFLLFAIAWSQGSARSTAEGINRRLVDSEERLRATNKELEQKMAEGKITEGLLAYERDLLRMLLDHSPDPIYFKDAESRFIKCGRAISRHLGITYASEALGKTDFDFYTEEHARPAFECEQQIIRTGQPVIGLVEKETWPDGRETWVLTSKMPLRDKQGMIIGTFGITKDITKLKEAERELEKEKELLAVTLRSIGDGVITTDVNERIVLFNQVAERLTGWTAAQATGRHLSEVFHTNGLPDGETNAELLGRVLSGDVLPPVRDAVLVARGVGERNISQSFAPIIDHDERIVGAVLVFHDITERLMAEAELLKASKLESIGSLAGGIAHDFNNALTVILGNISLARLANNMGRPVADSLVEAENASLRARELTQRLLTFARGGAPIKKPLHLAPLTRECAARALENTDVVAEFFLGDDLWVVEADEAQIVQVLQNLINHARGSMSKDPRMDIHVLNQEVADDRLLFLKQGRYVRVSIRDYGAGIQQENLTKIFEPYFGPKKQGSGLELATAYSIVRKHEGQIRVESIAGQGTVFHIYLPAVEVPVAVPLPPVRVLRPGSVPRRVLVMDDELPIRKLAVQLLQRIGCTVETAADGAEAIELYESARQRGEPFGAVIMDLTVPNGMGGKETIRELRARDPEVLAIVSSGYSNDPVMANFRDFGFAGVMPKPYSSEELATALDDLFFPVDDANVARQ
jgi:PAS domain S-box-containing protein